MAGLYAHGPANFFFNHLTSSESEFLATYYNYAYRSSDGLHWTGARMPKYSSTGLTLVATGGSYLVADNYDGVGYYAGSSFAKWRQVTDPNLPSYPTIAAGGGRFVAVGSDGRVAYSPDGRSWTVAAAPTGPPLDDRRLVYVNDRFLIFTTKDILVSADGTAWAALTPDLTIPVPDHIAYIGGTYLAERSSLSVSRDLAAWTRVGSWLGGGTPSLAYAPDLDLFITPGKYNPNLMSSRDGVTWGVSQTDPGYGYDSVTWGAGRFVATSVSGSIISSSDGVAWTSAQGSPFGPTLYGVAEGDGVFLAVGGGGRVLRSTDGRVWTAANSGYTGDLLCVTHGAPGFVAGSRDGALLFSADGTSWTSWTNPNSTTFTSVAYGAGIFLAAAGSNGLLVSRDGTVWQSASVPEGITWLSISYSGGRFIAPCYPGNPLTPYFAESEDGINWWWTPQTLFRGAAAFAFNGAREVASSEGGIIYQDGCLPEISSLTPDSGPPGVSASVTLNGSGLSGATEVYFGMLPATSFTVNSDLQIMAQAPPQAETFVPVTVTTRLGTSIATFNSYFVYGSRPIVTGVTEITSPYSFRIQGSQFRKGSSVLVNGSGVFYPHICKPTSLVIIDQHIQSYLQKGVPASVVVISKDGSFSEPYWYTP